MSLTVPNALFRDERDDFKCGDWIEVWWNDTYSEWVIEGNNARVFDVDFTRETLSAFVFYENDVRYLWHRIPFECCELISRPDVSGVENRKMRKAMDRFAKRFVEHAKRPGGTKPGQTVTRETAMGVARGCARRADRRSDN